MLHACRDARVPVVATMHNYRLVCSNGMFFRDGAVCHDCTKGLPVRAVVHGCYRDSRAATVPVALARVCTGRHGDRWYRPTYSSQRHSVTCTRGSASRPTAIFVRYNLIPRIAGGRHNADCDLCGPVARG